MLNAIFSAFHSILDLDKYSSKNNTIYIVSPEQNLFLNMDVENKIDVDEESSGGSLFEIVSDRGDVIVCKRCRSQDVITSETEEREVYQENIPPVEERLVVTDKSKDKEVCDESAEDINLSDLENSRIRRLLRKFSDLSERQAKIIEQGKIRKTFISYTSL